MIWTKRTFAIVATLELLKCVIALVDFVATVDNANGVVIAIMAMTGTTMITMKPDSGDDVGSGA